MMQKLIDKYNVIETVTVNGMQVSIIDISMMTDEHWNQLAAAQKVRAENEARLKSELSS